MTFCKELILLETNMHWLKLFIILWIPLSGIVFSQDFPNKPIRVVVPFPPGGGGDVLMRPLSKRLSEILGQSIVIDNKPGANGNIGAAYVAKALPDGYTLLLGNSSIPISVGLYNQLGYDPLKDLSMIGLVGIAPSTLVSNPAFSPKTMSELILYAKNNPGRVNYASAGSGSTPHLAIEMLKMVTGTNFTHVPYKGGGPAVAAVLGGEVQILVTNTSTILTQVQAGKLHPIAVTSLKRSPIMANVPTMAETIPSFEIKTWYGLMGPANIPKEIILRLNQVIVQAVNTPELKNQLVQMGYEPESSSPEILSKLLKDDIVQWGQVVRASGAKVD
jgi:tripartite-type tricarboxylate transporter receptor subunit TctC